MHDAICDNKKGYDPTWYLQLYFVAAPETRTSFCCGSTNLPLLPVLGYIQRHLFFLLQGNRWKLNDKIALMQCSSEDETGWILHPSTF